MRFNDATRRARPHRLLKNEAGFVLVFLAIAIPAILGLIGLALDGIRLMSLDTDTANIADAAALAAADRLDRSTDAIPQARAAALALLNKSAADWRGDARPRLSFRFARRLADLRQSPGFSLSDSAGVEAQFVEVRASEASLTTSFLQLVGARAAPLERRAIAESQYYACDVTPAVLCQPDPAAFAAQARPGQQYLLRMDGNIVAGSIALLDRPDAEGGRQALRDLASNAPQFCYADGLRLRRNISPLEFDEAVNVRFDRYVGRSGPIAPDLAIYPPAPDIIQGRHLATCNSPPQGGDINPPYHLPRDTAYEGLRLNGLWDQGIGDWKITPPIGGTGLQLKTALDEYLAWNHADKGTAVLDRFRNAPTRYDLYLAELGLDRSTEKAPVDTRSLGASVATMPTGGPVSGPLRLVREHAAPFCYAGTQPAVDPQRRVIDLSVADCGQFPEAATASVLSRHVAKFFLTEPTDTGMTLVEFIGLLRPRDDADKLRHIVQLVDGN
ncbi:pilus assembly protein TadG-related protein [Lichenifustis flavocetrariae]|uniref:Pilus assembly protein TadG-related protein n=1 Tax=Lichenifustis flavocetrariae TaxID=2949735 RepID=A0AA41Z7X2_9HYPH|nr:pilus assembly protein TadG-related protein [Lichenifustis flavocetrariae]MCW6511950.1 pilus assembly protein TadG-related protein [Lichenifustis flavocetrariae]